jgi:hypothetical protein
VSTDRAFIDQALATALIEADGPVANNSGGEPYRNASLHSRSLLQYLICGAFDYKSNPILADKLHLLSIDERPFCHRYPGF